MKGIKSAGFMCLIAAIGATGCQSAAEREAEAMTTLQSLSQMELMEMAFDGNPTVSEIQPVLDRALRLYRMPITEENYSRAGSVLVALRKEFGPSEMDILGCVISSHVPGADMSSFKNFMAICAVLEADGE